MRTIPLKTAHDLLKGANALKFYDDYAASFEVEDLDDTDDIIFLSIYIPLLGNCHFSSHNNKTVKIENNRMLLITELGEPVYFELLIIMHLDSSLGCFDNVEDTPPTGQKYE
jgi:hypothetical protein